MITHLPAAPSGGDVPIEVYSERANLFPIGVKPLPTELYMVRHQSGQKAHEELRFTPIAGATVVDADPRRLRWAIQASVLRGVAAAGLSVKKGPRPTIVDKDSNLATQAALRIYPAYELQVAEFGGQRFLCLDHRLRVHANLSLGRLMAQVGGFLPLPEQRVLVRSQGGWEDATLVEVGSHGCELVLASGETSLVASKDVVPDLTRDQIVQLAPILGVRTDQLERTIKQLSLLTIANASRARLDACVEFAERLASGVFPIQEGHVTISIRPTPAALRPPAFVVGKDLVEPSVAFDRIDVTKRTGHPGRPDDLRRL